METSDSPCNKATSQSRTLLFSRLNSWFSRLPYFTIMDQNHPFKWHFRAAEIAIPAIDLDTCDSRLYALDAKFDFYTTSTQSSQPLTTVYFAHSTFTFLQSAHALNLAPAALPPCNAPSSWEWLGTPSRHISGEASNSPASECKWAAPGAAAGCAARRR